MADHRNAGAPGASGEPVSKPGQTVRRAAQAVIEDVSRHLDPKILKALHEAVLNPDIDACRGVVANALAGGVRPEDLADFYIPAISRHLGEMWCVDEMSFAGVTIGVSRLQGLLRELGPNWSGDLVLDPLAPLVLLVVPQEVYHTLGAIILSGQLRRKGVSVKLVLGEQPHSIAQRIQRTNYQGVFISASQSESLESLRRMIDVVRKTVQTAPPIVIGGGILEIETTETVTALTGADYATRHTTRALTLCGIRTHEHSNPSKKKEA